LAAEPSLQQEKWADETPSTAWSLPTVSGPSPGLCLITSLQPGDVMVRDYETLFLAGQAGHNSRKTHIMPIEIDDNYKTQQKSYCWYGCKSHQL